ncbi:hypothetical protein ACI4A4_28390, partial [Klebsiella pneumoniae]|uniref:hypothetical protein n=1 Tax=Klebsiella pneumoniae TaxID=573 RepID=UPI003854D6C4
LSLDSVTTGTLSADRLPLIDHNSLSNIGSLTHAQLESIIAGLETKSDFHFSDLNTANRLNLALALKRQGITIGTGLNNDLA